MNLHDFYYELPLELIAQSPLAQREQSRLLVLDKETGDMKDCHFAEIVDFLTPGDCLVLNDTRVLPARLLGKKKETGGELELVLLHQLDKDEWEVMVRPGKRAKPGASFTFGDNLLECKVLKILDNGNRVVHFSYEGEFFALLDKIGLMPLPPYIKNSLSEKERYQTVYSKDLGSAAAPTAGLHFTKELLQKIEDKGIHIVYLTLHVGIGTFRPVKTKNIEEHEMHSEYYSISQESADTINACRQNGGKIVCVGTTSCRTLETVADSEGHVRKGSGWTNIFIYPGYRFKVVDRLITNFHLPESTLIMLVASLAGKDRVMAAYRHAVEQNYRFFSFGDAMYIK